MEDSILTKKQDRNSEAWLRLCDYIDKAAEEERKVFAPADELGINLFSQLYTLPESIAKLKKVRQVILYRSNINLIPPEIGEMESLEYLDTYTSNDLHWYPYEITRCTKLKDSRVSTRVVYGNFKNRMQFPDLSQKLVRYHGNKVKCSICRRPVSFSETNQLWITLYIGTDHLPLLANVCSGECKKKLPTPSAGYPQHPHKGGPELIQAESQEEFVRRFASLPEEEQKIIARKLNEKQEEERRKSQE